MAYLRVWPEMPGCVSLGSIQQVVTAAVEFVPLKLTLLPVS